MTICQRHPLLTIACFAAAIVIPHTAGVVVAADKKVSTTGSMQIRVVNSDGQAVPGAAIYVGVWTDEAFDHNRDYKCDAAGEAKIQLPKTLTILRIWARSDRYVPLFAGWWPEHQVNDSAIPEEFSFRLSKGSVIGGVVKNEDGQPIEGAKVEVMRVDRADDTKERPVVDTWLAFGDAARTTDADGRWTLDNVPADELTQVLLKISHPDYIDDQSWGEMQQQQDLTMEAIRARTAAIVMHRGVKLSGTVTDADGKPVAGAVVIFGDGPYQQEGSQEVRTGEDGTYRFPPLPPSLMRVTVVAQGWMPQLRKIEITPENKPVDFQLEPGKALRVRFVDPAGNPIPKVAVQIANWRGAESLYNHKHPDVLDTNIPRVADENGMYEWTWVPDDAVTYDFGRPMSAPAPWTTVTMIADGTHQTVTLPPLPLVISGSVVDYETGEPIEEFTVLPVLESSQDQLLVERGGVIFPQGRYRLAIVRGGAYRVRVEAEGYRSAMSDEAFRLGDANTICDFQLRPAAPAAGRVLDARGNPIADAVVVLATSTQPFKMVQHHKAGQNDLTFGENHDRRKRLSNGCFSFPAQFERYTVIAFDGSGYVERICEPEQSPGDLVLEECARVEGRVLDGGKPAAGREVMLRPLRLRSPSSPKIDDRFIEQTDAEGRFIFDRVPPVKSTVAYEVSMDRDKAASSSESLPLDLQAGQHVTAEFGGGVVVRGRVVSKGPAGRDIDLKHCVGYLLHKTRGIKPPLEVAMKRFDWRKGWSDAFIDTPEGAAYLQTLHHYLVKLNGDGSFGIPGVPEGDYELTLKIANRLKDSANDTVGYKIVRFRVDKTDVKRGTFDVPEIEMGEDLSK